MLYAALVAPRASRNARRNGRCLAHTQAAIDACVVFGGHARGAMPLHESQCAAIAGVKKDVVHLAAFIDQHPLVDQHLETQLVFVEMACGRHVARTETQMINGHMSLLRIKN